MGDHALDRDVYIRSMGARGHLGGLAWSTPQAVRVLDSAGCDVVVVETVGVGQSEVEVAGLADTTLVLLAPGMGDGIQAAKAGILEIGDVYAVNKADREGADRTRRELRTMLAMAERRDGAWRPPVVQTVATTGVGIDDLLAEVDRHAAWLRESGELARRRTLRARREVEAIALAALRERWGRSGSGADLDALAERVVAGEVDPYAAADELLDDDAATSAEAARASCMSSARRRVQASSTCTLTPCAVTVSRWRSSVGVGAGTDAITVWRRPTVSSTVSTASSGSGPPGVRAANAALLWRAMRATSSSARPWTATASPSAVASSAEDGPSRAPSTSTSDVQRWQTGVPGRGDCSRSLPRPRREARPAQEPPRASEWGETGSAVKGHVLPSDEGAADPRRRRAPVDPLLLPCG
jgi:LAO/AO transport system ATPase